MMMVGETDTLLWMDAQRFQASEKPFRLCDTGERHDRVVLETLCRWKPILVINTVDFGSESERRYRQSRYHRSRNIPHASRMRPRHGGFGFTPSTRGKQDFTGGPLNGVDGDDVDVAMKPAMLKP